MINIKVKHDKSVFYSFAVAVFSLLSASALAQDNFTLLVPPLHDGGVKSAYGFYNDKNQLSIAYQLQYPDRPSDIFYVSKYGEKWGSPLLVNISNGNRRQLHGVVNLSNGMPLLVMSGDNTDYSKIFGITTPPNSGTAPNSQLIPGVQNEDLQNILSNNQRLYFSLQANGKWTEPMAISDTFRPIQPLLISGEDGSAIVVYAHNSDESGSTLNNIELYAVTYHNHTWSKPVRVTNNSKIDYGYQVKYVGGEYLLTWIEDEDNQLSDRSDSKLYWASISPNGSLIKTTTPIVGEAQKNPELFLGTSNDEAILLWASQYDVEGKPQRSLWETHYKGSWSSVKNTGLSVLQPSRAAFHNTPQGLILSYIDGGALNTAFYQNEKWTSSGISINFNDLSLKTAYKGLFVDRNNNLLIAAAGHNPVAGEESTNSSDAGDGLYYMEHKLISDLTLAISDIKPYIKHLDTDVTVSWQVSNVGSSPSSNYTVELKDADSVLKSFSGESLLPGESKSYDVTFPIKNSLTPILIEVKPDSEDGDIDNNILKYSLSVLPDFQVRSIRRIDATHFSADIVELKGIAAPPVKVEFYLESGQQRSLLATGEYDSSSGLPIMIETSALIDRSGKYKVSAKVNGDRVVKEDNYSNNQAAYNHVGGADFTISRMNITEDTVYITIKNKGDLTAPAVDLLVTDDPMATGQNKDGVKPWYYQNINFDGKSQVEITIPRSDHPAIQGQSLYAIVNPYGEVPERDRNNNQHKILLSDALSTSGGGGTGGGSGTGGGNTLPEPVLAIESINSWCGNIQVKINNSGNESAIASSIEIVDQFGINAAMDTIPLLVPNQTETLSFQNLDIGQYTVRLNYLLSGGEQRSATKQVSLVDSEVCRDIADNDIRIVDLNINKSTDPSGNTIVNVSVSGKGYQTDYLKPFIRVPVQLEIKRGITTVFEGMQMVYLPGGAEETETTANFNIPSEVSWNGKLHVTARAVVRDDENQASNNQLVLEVAQEK